MQIDPATDLPFCYGHEDAKSKTCMTCDAALTCRETMKLGAGTPVLIIESDAAALEQLRLDVEAEDSDEDDDGDEDPTEES